MTGCVKFFEGGLVYCCANPKSDNATCPSNLWPKILDVFISLYYLCEKFVGVGGGDKGL